MVAYSKAVATLSPKHIQQSISSVLPYLINHRRESVLVLIYICELTIWSKMNLTLNSPRTYYDSAELMIYIRFSNTLFLFFIRILFFRPRLNIPIFLPILGWKYSCNILNYSLWHFSFWLVLPFRERNNFIHLSKHISLYCMYKFSTHEIIFFSQLQPQVYS